MQKVLITGANGFLGYYLTDLLLAKGYHVFATGKGTCRLPYTGQRYHYRSLDFTDDASVKLAFADIQPDVVVHSGAISKPDFCEANKEQAFRTNVTGTINLLNHAHACKAHFILLSTDFVFSGSKHDLNITAGTGFYKEDDQRAPVNYYGETKVLAEDEVMRYAFSWSVVRTVLVYGKSFSGRDNIVTTVAAGLKKGERLRIFNDQVRTPTYVEDLAAGIESVIQKKAEGIYHISGEEVFTSYKTAVAVAKHLNYNTDCIEAVTADSFQPFPGAAKRPLVTPFDITKAKEVLSYSATPLQVALQKIYP